MYYFSASYRMPVGYPCFAPGVTENLCHLARGGNLKETTDYLRSFGPWAIVVSFFLDVLINALGFLPSIFYQRQMVLSLVCLLGLLYPGWPKSSVWCLIFLCFAIFCVMKRKSSLQRAIT